MKLKRLILENFRCYKNPIFIEIDDITTIIGKNDVGKSTILEALEIFFNNDIVKIAQDDVNIDSDDKHVIITCDFEELPDKLILDSGAETNLKDEFLEIEPGVLRIKKVYDCSRAKCPEEVYIVAQHPTVNEGADLLKLKEKDLQKIIKDKGLDAKLKGNPSMRKAIWNSLGDLQLQPIELSVAKSFEDKSIWSKLESYLPMYALFQSDRQSTDSDDEVQNPMKAAIQEAIDEVNAEIAAIEKKVREKATEIAKETQEALNTIDSELAKAITPDFKSPAAAKWNGLFSITMKTDQGISLNKRGSGVRRMILVSFFKAQAERKAKTSNHRDIIYAIEEPETAQHPNNQKILVDSFREISQSENCQVLLTTHSPNLAQELPLDSLRFVCRDNAGNMAIESGTDQVFEKITETLGIFASNNLNVQVVICVEGITDVDALKHLNRCVREKHPNIVDISTDARVAILPVGGSSLKYWVEKRLLDNLHCKECHIYDNDVKSYQASIDAVNARGDGSWGTLTCKYEIENYLHTDAIKAVYGVNVDTSKPDVPKAFGIAFADLKGFDAPMGSTKSKTYLTKVFMQGMNGDLLTDIDPADEVKGWFEKIDGMLN